MIEKHSDHNVIDFTKVFPEALQLVVKHKSLVENQIVDLMETMNRIEDALSNVDNDADVASTEIKLHFKVLHESLIQREEVNTHTYIFSIHIYSPRNSPPLSSLFLSISLLISPPPFLYDFPSPPLLSTQQHTTPHHTNSFYTVVYAR